MLGKPCVLLRPLFISWREQKTGSADVTDGPRGPLSEWPPALEQEWLFWMHWNKWVQAANILFYLFIFFLNFYFILLYNTVLVLPYIDMNPPQVYMCSPSWTLPTRPSPSHSSGSSQCTNPEHPLSCIRPGLAIHFTYDNIHVSMPFS